MFNVPAEKMYQNLELQSGIAQLYPALFVREFAHLSHS